MLCNRTGGRAAPLSAPQYRCIYCAELPRAKAPLRRKHQVTSIWLPQRMQHRFLNFLSIKKILIIEDDKPIARALEQKLTRAGFVVTSVFNGKDATNLLKKISFDTILLDLMMPTMDGFAVLRSLSKQRITTPVMMLSNIKQENYTLQARELGVKDFIIKADTPIATIVEHVRQLVK